MELESGCFVPVSHALNADGYFRKSWGNQRTNDRQVEFFHRYIFRSHNDLAAIPLGYEINHTCHTRCCANPQHLELIERSYHKSITNRKRKIDCDEAGVNYGTRNRKRVLN